MRVWLIDRRDKVWECTVLDQSATRVTVRCVVATRPVSLPRAALAGGILEHRVRVPLHWGPRRWVEQTMRFTADPAIAGRFPPGPI